MGAAMPYAEGTIIHDADAHIMETPDFLDDHLEAAYRNRIDVRKWYGGPTNLLHDSLDALRRRHDDPVWRAESAAKIMIRKNYDALGSWRRDDRPCALDHLGFASQLVFTTWFLGLMDLELGGDLDLTLGVARAVNRAMVNFCAADKRLLATCYVPMADFEGAATVARDALELGAKGLLIPSRCPRGHSPSHIGFDRLWAMAEEAGVPILFHVGGGGQLISPDYFRNGLAPVPDFHGGDGNFRSVDYMAIPYPPMQTMATLIFDRVPDRFPRLKFGVIEQGASWVPGWMRMMDSAHEAFFKNEERLQKMSLRPSEFVRRQVRVTPYPAEDTGWIVANCGEDVCMFSSDYPHVEGGRNPLRRFAVALEGASEFARRRFYRDNFVDLMGEGLAPELR
jgi:predicted TIM-barrel fold metal-dependent hydrolase